jgi:plastocyanin
LKTRIASSFCLGLLLALSACSASSPDWTPLPSGVEPPAVCARADSQGVIEISADQLKFSTPCMVAAAGQEFVVQLTNLESEPHNAAIYADRSKATSVMVGDTISGPNKTIDYPATTLTAGEYYFVCVVHPAVMNGALYVR